MKTISVQGITMPCYSYTAVVVGSGAAGLNCADLLYKKRVDVCLVTEGMKMGTSRNTGSDKQTYYKLTLTGSEPDSVALMAQTLFDGGCMNGDIALCEAANSTRAFMRLVELGVPFPTNEYGEYVGYKTDHDPRSRATSCGPLTSKYMTEALEKAVLADNIPIFDNMRVCEIITDKGKARGLICTGASNEYNDCGLYYFNCGCIVYAVGGPSSIYGSSVYPESQTCGLGAAFLAGADGVNLTESQYGIASLGFHWNLSGSYQQVIPRYYVTDSRSSYLHELDVTPYNIFLKGYQWPFDASRLSGSSSVDIAVYRERMRGNRVYMDFTRNPVGFDFDSLPDEAKTYLEKSDATQDTPIKRLRAMNDKAYQLFFSNGYDLENTPIEIGVCAQHNNGGLAVNTDYMTNIDGLYAVGECAGVFGVRRPGGSALNSTQVSSMRAAKHIADTGYSCSDYTPLDFGFRRFLGTEPGIPGDLINLRKQIGSIVDGAGAFVRNGDNTKKALSELKELLDSFSFSSDKPECLREICIAYDTLITAIVYLSAIDIYIDNGGSSRGAYIVNGNTLCDTQHNDECLYITLSKSKIISRFEKVRPVPTGEQWFEKVYSSVSRR